MASVCFATGETDLLDIVFTNNSEIEACDEALSSTRLPLEICASILNYVAVTHNDAAKMKEDEQFKTNYNKFVSTFKERHAWDVFWQHIGQYETYHGYPDLLSYLRSKRTDE